MKQRINIALILLLAIAIVSCKPTDEKMVEKINRRMLKADERIEKFETRKVGLQQQLELVEERIAANPEGAVNNNGEKKKKKIKDLEKKLASLKKELGADTIVAVENIQSNYVTVIQPEKKKFQKYIDIQGAVTSKDNVIISSNTGGLLETLFVTEGQSVSRGQVLAKVNSDVIESNIAEFESQLTLAVAVYERQKRLWEEQNIGTEIQFLQAKNNKENIEKRLETLHVQLRDASVYATISGVVNEVIGVQGALVGPGSPIVQVVNLINVQVEAEIPESFSGVFKKGDNVEVYFQSIDVTKSATIKAIGQTINPGNRTFKIEVDLSNRDKALKPYMLATLKLKEYESNDEIIIPTRLIQDGSKGNFVYVVEGNLVAKKWITMGETYNGESEISEGLQGDETIIDLGFRDVLEGETIEIKEN